MCHPYKMGVWLLLSGIGDFYRILLFWFPYLKFWGNGGGDYRQWGLMIENFVDPWGSRFPENQNFFIHLK